MPLTSATPYLYPLALVILMVIDDLAPIRCQAINNNHADLVVSKEYHMNHITQYACHVTSIMQTMFVAPQPVELCKHYKNFGRIASLMECKQLTWSSWTILVLTQELFMITVKPLI